MEQAMQPQENNEKEEMLYSTEGFLSKLNKWQFIICFFVFPALCGFFIMFGYSENGKNSYTLTENILFSMFGSSLVPLFHYFMYGKDMLLSTNKLTLTNKGIIYKTSKKIHYIPWNDISKVTKSSGRLFDRYSDKTGCILHIKKKDFNCIDIYLSGFKLDENFLKIFNEYISINIPVFEKIDKSFIKVSNKNCNWIPFFAILTIGLFPLLLSIAFATT